MGTKLGAMSSRLTAGMEGKRPGPKTSINGGMIGM